jgi:hypothetical protein
MIDLAVARMAAIAVLIGAILIGYKLGRMVSRIVLSKLTLFPLIDGISRRLKF